MDKKASAQKIFVLIALIVLTLIVLIVVPAIWLGYGQTTSGGKPVETTLFHKILFTFAGLILLVGGWWLYFRQKKIEEGNYQKGVGDKIIETGYKVSGYVGVGRAIIALIVGVILLVFSIGVAFFGLGTTTGQGNETTGRLIIGGIFFILSVIVFIRAWVYWWRSKPLREGRMY